MAVHLLLRGDGPLHDVLHGPEASGEHDLSALGCVVLRPCEVAPVCLELWRPFCEVGEVRIGEVDEVLLHDSLRRLDVHLSELIADAS